MAMKRKPILKKEFKMDRQFSVKEGILLWENVILKTFSILRPRKKQNLMIPRPCNIASVKEAAHPETFLEGADEQNGTERPFYIESSRVFDLRGSGLELRWSHLRPAKLYTNNDRYNYHTNDLRSSRTCISYACESLMRDKMDDTMLGIRMTAGVHAFVLGSG